MRISINYSRSVSLSVMPTLYDSMGCSPLGSSIHGIVQARILEDVVIPFSKGSSWPRDQTQVSCIVGRFLLYSPHLLLLSICLSLCYVILHSFTVLCHLILMTILWIRYYYLKISQIELIKNNLTKRYIFFKRKKNKDVQCFFLISQKKRKAALNVN